MRSQQRAGATDDSRSQMRLQPGRRTGRALRRAAAGLVDIAGAPPSTQRAWVMVYAGIG